MSTQVADSLSQIKEEFEKRSGLRDVDAEVKSRSDGDVLILYVAHPTNRLFRVLQDAQGDDVDAKVTIKRRAKLDSLHSAEGRFLLRTLTESLNINRFSFADDFFSRDTKSVSAAEEQITSTANHVVFGRRGSGKSSLLLYAMHTRANAGQPSIWIDMQVYSHRNDNGVAIEVLSEILKEVGRLAPDYPEALIVEAQVEALRQRDPLPDSEIRKVLPMFRRILQRISDSRSLVLFLDDFHAMSPEFQPKLLGFLYSVARGNQVYLKLSAIPTLTRTWDTGRHMGLQIPHDAQTITLDYNLTVPHKAIEHIQSILDAHAQYCGFPSVRVLCTSKNVINRLVWVAAGRMSDSS